MGYPRPYVNVTKQDDRNLICGLAGVAQGSKACLVCTKSWLWSPGLHKPGMMAQPVMSALRKQKQENQASQDHPQLPKPSTWDLVSENKEGLCRLTAHCNSGRRSYLHSLPLVFMVVYPRPAGSQALRESPVSSPHFTIGELGLQLHAAVHSIK